MLMEMMKTTMRLQRRQKRQRHDSDRDSGNGVGGGGGGKSDDDDSLSMHEGEAFDNAGGGGSGGDGRGGKKLVAPLPSLLPPSPMPISSPATLAHTTNPIATVPVTVVTLSLLPPP